MTQKHNVYEDYELIAEWYDQHRSRDLFEIKYLEVVTSLLEPKAKILDLGCGMGEPIAQYFIEKGFNLTGIDGSSKLIQLASQRFPTAKFIVQDMRTINFNEKFDCVIAWNSFFHLPCDDQRKMFTLFKEHLTEDGILVFTTGDLYGEVLSDNGGRSLYHASLTENEYIKLLHNNNFQIITYKLNDPECEGTSVWIAKAPKK